MKKSAPYKGYLIDIEGVLVRDKRYQPIDGSVAWLQALRDSGTPFCLVSNNTTHRPADLIGDLNAAGFPVTPDHLVGTLDLSRQWLRKRHKQRIMWLGTPTLASFWQDSGFELVTAGPCEAVVLGVDTTLSVADLDRALAPLLDQGADLVCLHRNGFYLDEQGERRLGPGAWAAALAAVGGTGRVITVGKPSERIYNEALKRIGVTAAEVLFISDDPVNDLVTARKLGMTTAFLLSGKYVDHAVLGNLAEQDWPHIICNSLGDIERPVPPHEARDQRKDGN